MTNALAVVLDWPGGGSRAVEVRPGGTLVIGRSAEPMGPGIDFVAVTTADLPDSFPLASVPGVVMIIQNLWLGSQQWLLVGSASPSEETRSPGWDVQTVDGSFKGIRRLRLDRSPIRLRLRFTGDADRDPFYLLTSTVSATAALADGAVARPQPRIATVAGPRQSEKAEAIRAVKVALFDHWPEIAAIVAVRCSVSQKRIAGGWRPTVTEVFGISPRRRALDHADSAVRAVIDAVGTGRARQDAARLVELALELETLPKLSWPDLEARFLKSGVVDRRVLKSVERRMAHR